MAGYLQAKEDMKAAKLSALGYEAAQHLMSYKISTYDVGLVVEAIDKRFTKKLEEMANE